MGEYIQINLHFKNKDTSFWQMSIKNETYCMLGQVVISITSRATSPMGLLLGNPIK